MQFIKNDIMASLKKETLQKILEALIPYWDLVEGFLLLLKSDIDENIIDSLYETIESEIKNINNENDRNNIKNVLKKIKEQELKENEKEDKYLEDLINNI